MSSLRAWWLGIHGIVRYMGARLYITWSHDMANREKLHYLGQRSWRSPNDSLNIIHEDAAGEIMTR